MYRLPSFSVRVTTNISYSLQFDTAVVLPLYIHLELKFRIHLNLRKSRRVSTIINCHRLDQFHHFELNNVRATSRLLKPTAFEVNRHKAHLIMCQKAKYKAFSDILISKLIQIWLHSIIVKTCRSKKQSCVKGRV